MFKRLLWMIFVFPLGVILIALGIANRHMVSLKLDPFKPEAPSIALETPLYLIVFGAMLVGLLFGAFTTWVSQGKYRRSAKRITREARDWQARAEDLERKVGTSSEATPLALSGRR